MKDLPIKVLIVDDEPLARKRIRALLANTADVKIVAECANGVEAVEAIETFTPDLMFLDVQMPEMDGLSVIENKSVEPMPLVIFVTASANHGLAAFESHAVDYLLKPFDQKRFEKALEKARARFTDDKNKGLPSEFAKIINRAEIQSEYRRHIAIRQDGRIFLVKTENIEWITADRNYVRLHVGRESYLRRETIGNIEQQLDPNQFRRVHRSAIVNMNFIKELRSVSGDKYQILLSSGEELIVSRTYQKNLPEFLDWKS